MRTITEITLPILFMEGSYVDFYLSDGSHYIGKIKLVGKCFIDIEGCSNDIVFHRIGIYHPEKFVKDIVGYDTDGAWPCVKTLDDLRKVLDALKAYNPDRIPEDRKVIISDDEKKPFTLSVKKHKQTKLNFKL